LALILATTRQAPLLHTSMATTSGHHGFDFIGIAMEMTILWNVGLTAALGLIGWLARLVWSEQQRLQILINKTREEMAKEYVTKVEVHADINRVLDRLERLDSKIDKLFENKS
jgi:hypothetical protein